MEQTRLLRNFAVYKSTFDKFSGLLENARVAKASQPSDVKIVARAVDAVALSSRFLRTISIFGMVGFFSTLLLAFFLESVTKVRAKMD